MKFLNEIYTYYNLQVHSTKKYYVLAIIWRVNEINL